MWTRGGPSSDHPRIRGEHPLLTPGFRDGMGSSPHTRGAPTSCRWWRSRPRIIPAYAGSTSSRSPRRYRLPDHPRIRGEHHVPLIDSVWQPGSSPHTRGARRGPSSRFHRVGIIPAYAGSTPRVSLINFDSEGSSPHTRGARADERGRLVVLGIIPAYAGSTSPRCSIRRLSGDHPRIRGEHADHELAEGVHEGSSPHTRGAPPMSCRPRKSRRDHPRIRGEHLLTTPSSPWNAGSSPHTRGALHDRVGGQAWSRIIPAYAGSTRQFSGRFARRPDHPRIRGEHEV